MALYRSTYTMVSNGAFLEQMVAITHALALYSPC